jgi:hypothetical protein
LGPAEQLQRNNHLKHGENIMIKKALIIGLCTGIAFSFQTFLPSLGVVSAMQKQTPPIRLQASQYIPQKMLQGPNYWVEEGVRNDGFINTYTLQTAYGLVVTESTELLKIRSVELLAVEKLEKMRRTDVFKDAFTAAAKGPLKTVKGLFTSPVDTVTGTVKGLGHWFSDVGRSVVSDDPHQENVMKTALGFGAAKRKFAYELGVDPYSKFEPLQENLGELAWSAVGGGLTIKAAFGAIKDTPGKVVRGLGSSASMKKMVRDMSPEELEDINTEKLEKMGVTKSLIKAFLDNKAFNPQEATLLVGALEEMATVKDKDKFIAEASLAKRESVARFTRQRAQMMAGYQKNIAPVERCIDLKGALTFLQRKDGVVIGVFPLDYVASTEALWRKERNLNSAIKTLYTGRNKEIWITGTFSPAARQELEARGWKVVDAAGKKLGLE